MDNNLTKVIDVMDAYVKKGDGIYPKDATKILAEVISLLEAMLPEWPWEQFEQAMVHFKDVPWVKSAFHEAGWAMKGDSDDV